MSKKRPTESSWDSDEELLSDTAGISAFPKASELDLLAEDGDLDEEVLLGLDESAAGYSNEPGQVLTRQRSKNAVSAQQNVEPIVEQAFVFEEADTGDLEEDLAVNEVPGAYGNEGIDAYTHDVYQENGNGEATHQISVEEDHHQVYTDDINAPSEDYKHDIGDAGVYDGGEDHAGQDHTEDPSEQYTDMAAGEEQGEESTHVELEYEQHGEQSQQVHLEYEVDHEQGGSGQIEMQQEEEKTYESDNDSESDDDSRHTRGKFTSERTGVISLSAASERDAIPDTLEINKEQEAQIEEFMSDKAHRGRGRGGRNVRGRVSAHNRLGHQRGGMSDPSPGGPGLRGGMMGGPPRGPGMMGGPPRGPGMMGGPPRGPGMMGGPPRGPGMPRGMMGGRMPFGGMRQGMPPRGPMVGGMFNPMFRGQFPGAPEAGGGRGFPGERFPGDGLLGAPGLINPGALLGPMKQFLQSMRGPRPGGLMGPGGMRMPGPGPVRPGMGPRSLMGTDGPGGPRMMRGPGPGPMEQQLLALQQGQLRPPNRGRVPPHQRLGQLGAVNRVQMPDLRMPFGGDNPRAPFGSPPGQGPPGNKIFINPLFPGQQGGPSGLTRTVKMGIPVQQRKARELVDRAKQKQNRPTTAPVAAIKRKSTGGDDPASKVIKKESGESSRTVEKKEPMEEGSNSISSFEEQKRRREMIQKRKELARQRQAEEKRKELVKKEAEGMKIKSIVGRSGNSDRRTVEKSGDAASIKVVSRSVASRLGPPPTHNQRMQLNVRGPSPQQMRGPPPRGFSSQQRGPPPQNMRGPQPQQMRGLSPQQMRGPPPQGFSSPQMRGPPPQNMRSPQAQQMRGPPPQQMRGPQPQQMRGPPPQIIRSSPTAQGGDLRQRMRGPPPQVGGSPSVGQQQQMMRVPQQLKGPPTQGTGDLRQTLRGPPPQQIRDPPPQLIGSTQHQPRGPPQIRGPPPPQQFRGPAPQQMVRPPAPYQPQQAPSPQVVRPPPPSQFQSPPPHSSSYQAPPAAPRFASPPSYHYQQPPPQQQTTAPPPAAAYNPYPQPQAPPQAQPPSLYSAPPAQQHYRAPQYAPPPSSEPAPTYSGYPAPQHHQPPPQQSYAPPPTVDYHQHQTAPAYQQPQYPPASQSQPPQQHVTPAYQYSQPEAQAYTRYESQQTSSYAAPVYQGTPAGQQAQHYQPQATSHYSPHQDTGYHASHTDYHVSTQPIQTIQTLTSQTSSAGDQYNTPQRIQTIGQRIQPVSGTQMRSIIHNVSSPTHNTSPSSSSNQSRAPTVHISRAVMDGNVSVLAGSQKVIILNVPQMATRETLIKLCRHFGHVEGVNLMREQNKAVVQFQKGEQAAKCVNKCDQKCLHKTRLTVKLLPS